MEQAEKSEEKIDMDQTQFQRPNSLPQQSYYNSQRQHATSLHQGGAVPVQPLGKPAMPPPIQGNQAFANPYSQPSIQPGAQRQSPAPQTPTPLQHPQHSTAASRDPKAKPAMPGGSLTPWAVAAMIPGSIGSLDTIASRLNVPRLELRRFISENKELREALDDEMIAAKERLIEKTYRDGMDGQPQARQDFFKMVSGYFEKKNSRDEEIANSRAVIHLDSPSEQVQMLGDDGTLITIQRNNLSRFKGSSNDIMLPANATCDDDDEPDQVEYSGGSDTESDTD